MSEPLLDFMADFNSWLEAISVNLALLQNTMESVYQMLKGINRSLAERHQSDHGIEEDLAAYRAQKPSAVAGGARTTDPDTLMLDLQPYSEYLRMDRGNIFIAKYMDPEVGCPTEFHWREINTILKKRNYIWIKDNQTPKNSHWRKK